MAPFPLLPVPPFDRAFFAYAALLNAATAAVLATVVLTKSRRTGRDRSFLGFCVSTAWWNYFFFLWMSAGKMVRASSFLSLFLIGVPFTAVFFLQFCRSIAARPARFPWPHRANMAAAALFAVAGFSPLLVRGLGPVSVFPFWPAPGPLFWPLGLFLLANTLLAVVALGKAFREAHGQKRRHLGLTLFASIAAAAGGATMALPWVDVPWKPYGIAAVFVHLAVTAHGVLRYRLVDLNLAARNGLVYGLFGVLFVGPLLVIMRSARSDSVSSVLLVAGALAAPAFFQRLRRVLEGAVDSLPGFRARYDRYRNINRVLARLDAVTTSAQWADETAVVAGQIFDVRRIGVFLWDEGQRAFHMRAGRGLNEAERAFLTIPEASPLADALGDRRDILAADMAEDSFPPDRLAPAREELTFLGAALCAPVFSENRLEAVIALGPAADGGSFNDLDLSQLARLADAAAQSLRRVRGGLDRQKQFSMLAHDLAKPFGPKGSVGRLAKALETRAQGLPAELRHAAAQAFRELAFVGENLKELFQPNGKRPSAPVSLAAIYSRIHARYAEEAKEKGIVWTVSPPSEEARALCDPSLLEHRVIANLVENAFRHTPRGGAVELGHRAGNGFTGFVRDTGPGVPTEIQSRLFEPGAQGPGPKGEAGLGLASVKSVLESQGGQVWLESPTNGGAEFNFSLPDPAQAGD